MFGRVFCGWICLQTIFMKMIFRRIEYWIEGDAAQQKILAKALWNTDKILRKTAKWLAFWVLSFIIANIREQVCTAACPYGHLQSVLLDKQSIVVAYDHMRGETRGKFKKMSSAYPAIASIATNALKYALQVLIYETAHKQTEQLIVYSA